MKKIIRYSLILCFAIVSCGGDSEETETVEDEPVIDLPYEEGGAKDAEEYFSGVVEHVKRVDSKLRYIRDLDDMDASVDSINTELDSILFIIEEDRKILKLYEDKKWPKSEDFQDLTMAWYGSVEMLVNDHFYKLAEPMSRPDKTWSPQDKDLYYEYETAYFDDFFVKDKEWVDFQAEFAAANDISLGADTLDL